MREAREKLALLGQISSQDRRPKAVHKLTAEGAPIFDRILCLGPAFSEPCKEIIDIPGDHPELEICCGLTSQHISLICRSNPCKRSPHLSTCKNRGDALATAAWVKKRSPTQLFGDLRDNFPDPEHLILLHYVDEHLETDLSGAHYGCTWS